MARIRILLLNDKNQVNVVLRLRDATMPAILVIDNPITVELVHNGNSIRQEDDGFGQMVDVYLVEQVHTVNDSGKSWHLVIKNGVTDAYEDQLHDGQEKLVELSGNERFESSQLGYSLSYIR